MAGDIEAAEKDQELLAYLQGSTEVPVQTYYLGVSRLGNLHQGWSAAE